MSKKKTQKIFIPRGTIDPNEDTLIEIPVSLKEQSVIVANKHDADKSIRANRSTKSFISSERDFDESQFDQTISPRNRSGIRTNESQFTPNFKSTVLAGPTYSRDLDSTVIADLNVTEQEEKMLVQRKLDAFQEARRQFLIETTHVATKRTQTPNESEYQSSSRRSIQLDDSIPIKQSCPLDSSSFSSEMFGREKSKHVQTRFVNEDADEGSSSCRCSSK